MKNLTRCAIAVVIFLFTTQSYANQSDIESKAKAFTESLGSQLKSVKSRFPDDQNAFKAVINDVILPELDAKFFAYKVLGKHGTKMTNEQKSHFVDLLQTSLINNYVSILKRYNNEALVLEDVKKSESGKTAKTRIRIQSENKSDNETKLVLAWRFNKDKEIWAIYDLEAEGISLLQSKQKEINSIIGQHGIENMLVLLEDKVKGSKKEG